jgi:drug/metabolite transporter (DMT)-like permease
LFFVLPPPLNLSRLDALLFLMVLIWGSNFSVIKYALRDFPQIAFNAMRLLLASAVFLAAIVVVRRRAALGLRPPEPSLTGREWGVVFVLALVGTVLYQLFFLAGVARTSVANSALIFGCTPVAVAILSSIAGHERLPLTRWIGAGLSLLGIYALVGSAASLSSATLVGDALIFAGMLCWSVYSVTAQPLLKRHSPLVISGWSMIIGAALYTSLTAGSLIATNWSSISAISWMLMAGSSLLALAFSYIVWYTAVQRMGSARTAMYSNLTPIVAMAVAAIWLDERIGPGQLLGAALILTGLVLARARSRTA